MATFNELLKMLKVSYVGGTARRSTAKHMDEELVAYGIGFRGFIAIYKYQKEKCLAVALSMGTFPYNSARFDKLDVKKAYDIIANPDMMFSDIHLCDEVPQSRYGKFIGEIVTNHIDYSNKLQVMNFPVYKNSKNKYTFIHENDYIYGLDNLIKIIDGQHEWYKTQSKFKVVSNSIPNEDLAEIRKIVQIESV